MTHVNREPACIAKALRSSVLLVLLACLHLLSRINACWKQEMQAAGSPSGSQLSAPDTQHQQRLISALLAIAFHADLELQSVLPLRLQSEASRVQQYAVNDSCNSLLHLASLSDLASSLKGVNVTVVVLCWSTQIPASYMAPC